jgi:hypothetical protein
VNTLPLSRPLTAVLADDGNGNITGQASAGPEKYGESWKVTLLTTNTNSATETQLRVYRNVVSNTTMIDSTWAANQDTSTCDVTLRAGEKLVFVWSNGTAGANCYANIEGDLISRR